MGEGTVLGVAIAVVGAFGSVLVARISTPRPGADRPALDVDERDVGELRVSSEIWQRFKILEGKVDHLTVIVEQQREQVTKLERLLRLAMRVIRRANRRLRLGQLEPEEVPVELIPYSID
ncbi:hypothetical protein [Streptomyces sp. NPDC051561]|uniref:hypothetical protein n=1 Tax=Streptomyces sp. NPDC051561 TaxID=3365658 RepID=UPI00379BFACB